jgi:hypothetical protein
MRSGLKLFAKQTKKMIARQAGFSRNLIQIDRLLIAFVDERARATKPLVNFASGVEFGVSHFGEADFTASRGKGGRLWSAPAERSGDGALDELKTTRILRIQAASLGLPPHSKLVIPTDNSGLPS